MAEYKDVTSLKKEIADFKKVINSPKSDYLTGYICALSVTEEMIANLPNADVVEVRHGEWQQARYTEASLYICSECDKPEYKEHRYCPNCGAKMDGERR